MTARARARRWSRPRSPRAPSTPRRFGRLFERNVDGGIVAQPLVLHGVPDGRPRPAQSDPGGDRDQLGLRLRSRRRQPRSRHPAAVPAASWQPRGRVIRRRSAARRRRSGSASPARRSSMPPARTTLRGGAQRRRPPVLSARARSDRRLGDRRPPVRIAPDRSAAAATSPSTPTASATARRCSSGTASSTSPSAAWPATATVPTARPTAAGSPVTARPTWPRWRSSRPAPMAATPGSGRGAAVRSASAIGSTSMTGNGPGALGTRSSRSRPPTAPPGLTLAAAHQPPNHETLDRTDSDLGSGGPLWLPPRPHRRRRQGGALRACSTRARSRSPESRTARQRPPTRRLPGFVNSYHANPRAPACATQPSLDLPHELRHRHRPRLLRRPRPLSRR